MLSPKGVLVQVAMAVCLSLALSAQQFTDRAGFELDAKIDYRQCRLAIENGFVAIHVAGIVKNSETDQIEVFRWHGQKVVGLNLLKAVEGAHSMSVNDISIGPTGLVAMIATLADSTLRLGEGLFIYDSSAKSLNVFWLPEGRRVARLRVDEDENIWALGEGAESIDPSTLPMITKYDKKGKIVNEFLSRSEFPVHASLIKEGPDFGGSISFGLTDERIWFWLPEDQQLVTLRKDGSDVQKVKTGLPTWPGGGDMSEKILTVVNPHSTWLSSGRFLAMVGFSTESRSEHAVSLFEWQSNTATWRALPDNNLGGWFYGVDQNEMIFGVAYPQESVPFLEIGRASLPDFASKLGPVRK